MKFLRLSIFTLTICMLALNSFAQVQPIAADIASIRTDFNKINASSLTKEKFTYDAEGCVDGGVVTYFKDHNTIVKITESGSIGDGSWTTEYYYRSGKLFFCYETTIGGPAIGEVTKTERRFYVKNGKTIQMLEGKKVVQPESRATEILQTAPKLLAAYTTKDFAGAICNP